MLLLGAGDGLEKMADLQKTLSAKDRVCAYDRLGAGASDQPDRPQTLDDTGRVLTGVIDQVAGGAPVVLAGHSLGGLIAARYAPDHQDRRRFSVMPWRRQNRSRPDFCAAETNRVSPRVVRTSGGAAVGSASRICSGARTPVGWTVAPGMSCRANRMWSSAKLTSIRSW